MKINFLNRKIISTVIIFFMAINYSLAIGLPFNNIKQVFKADLQSQRVPAGKVVKIEILDDINTVKSLSGDQFSASLAQDIVVNKSIILPKGTIMRGVVEGVSESSRPKAPAVLYLSFDHIVTPLGKQVPVSLRLVNLPNITVEGGISAGGSYYEALGENYDSSIEFIKKSVNFGLDTGDVAKFVVTPVTAVGGSCISILMLFGKSVVNLFQKGNEVIINQGSVLTTMLTDPLDIPTN